MNSFGNTKGASPYLAAALVMMLTGCSTYRVPSATSSNITKRTETLNWMLRNDGIFQKGPWDQVGANEKSFSHVHKSAHGPFSYRIKNNLAYTIGQNGRKGDLYAAGYGSLVTHNYTDVADVLVVRNWLALGTLFIMDPTTLSHLKVNYHDGTSDTFSRGRGTLLWTFFPFYVFHSAEVDARRAASAIEYFRQTVARPPP